VKWPNDLVVDEKEGRLRKLAGILIDRVRTESNPNLAVVGVGINVRRPSDGIPHDLRSRVAFLDEFGHSSPELARVESTAVRAVAAAARRVARPGGASAVASECRRYLYGVGYPVTLDGVPVGVLRTIEDDGAATVEHEGILSTIYAGDLGVGAPT
jgi:biotin-(acetyl-CoA carboxylase) ligase